MQNEIDNNELGAPATPEPATHERSRSTASPPVGECQAQGLAERLNAIPIWLVRDMAPGWQEHGAAAYHAADALLGNSPFGSRREVDCPRCHEQCGWCSDPRWMHGTIKLPGSRRKCQISRYDPEGKGCPLCGGSKRAIRTVVYEARDSDASLAEDPKGQSGEAVAARA